MLQSGRFDTPMTFRGAVITCVYTKWPGVCAAEAERLASFVSTVQVLSEKAQDLFPEVLDECVAGDRQGRVACVQCSDLEIE